LETESITKNSFTVGLARRISHSGLKPDVSPRLRWMS
jgi:hypothetical protein